MTKYNFVLKVCGIYFLFAIFSVNTYSATVQFNDNFNDGIIDPTFWRVSGDGVSESGGTLNISRNSANDSLTSISSFSGLLDISFTVTLEHIVWNDVFHGISIMESSIGGTGDTNGVSFGFSNYGKFYSAWHKGGGTSWYYYAGPFSEGSTYSFHIMNDASYIYLLIDNSLIFTQPFNPELNYFIHFPGYYQDGDGDVGGNLAVTSSKIDNFSITATYVPLPSAALLFGSALLLLLGLRKCSINNKDTQ